MCTERHTRGVGDALEKHHNTSTDCAIVTLNSSLYLDYFAHFLKQNFTRGWATSSTGDHAIRVIHSFMFSITYLSANISNIVLIEISFYLWLVYVYRESCKYGILQSIVFWDLQDQQTKTCIKLLLFSVLYNCTLYVPISVSVF